MSELRQNLATGEWVIIAPERLKGKPLQPETNALLDTHPEYAPDCPFCPANEERFPHVEVDRLASADAHGPWRVRAIENKYKIFQHYEGATAPAEFERRGIYHVAAGCGDHELVLEHPVHNKTLATMTQAEAQDVIAMYLRRFRALRDNPNNLLTIMFKNHGPKSGASQLHSHCQILSSRVVPNHVRYLLEEATRYFDAQGTCVFCRMLDYELSEGTRVVYENERFAAYAPFAQPVPYEVHLFPKAHDSLFEDMGDQEAADFAECLRITMRKLYVALSNPDFNLIMRNPPRHLSGVPFYHWHLRVVPHTRMPGGFERGSRIMVNVVSPETSARALRDVTTQA